MLQRYSSRRAPLDSFLTDMLDGATAYDRIAGYFSSSVLEIAGEAIENVAGTVRMVCNSDLDPADVQTARSAALALRRERNESLPTDISAHLQMRLAQLYKLLRSLRTKQQSGLSHLFQPPIRLNCAMTALNP